MRIYCWQKVKHILKRAFITQCYLVDFWQELYTLDPMMPLLFLTIVSYNVCTEEDGGAKMWDSDPLSSSILLGK